MRKIKIFLVDDHPMMREALAIAFEREEDLEVIGEAQNGVEALKKIKELHPDIVIMDLLMPEMDGLTTTQKLVADNPDVKVLILTSMEDEERILASVQAGALGYYPKSAPRTYLLEAVRHVADGVPYMPAGITLKLFNKLRNIKLMPETGDDEATLTPRQLEVLTLMAEGFTDEQIGEVLNLGETTVRTHIHHILQRLNLDNRAQAVAYAARRMGKE